LSTNSWTSRPVSLKSASSTLARAASFLSGAVFFQFCCSRPSLSFVVVRASGRGLAFAHELDAFDVEARDVGEALGAQLLHALGRVVHERARDHGDERALRLARVVLLVAGRRAADLQDLVAAVGERELDRALRLVEAVLLQVLAHVLGRDGIHLQALQRAEDAVDRPAAGRGLERPGEVPLALVGCARARSSRRGR
jgi:hypothetical protein